MEVKMNKETLEEAAIINCESITYPYCDREKSMFIKGAKWQADRMLLSDVSGSLHSTTLEKSKDDFMECDVVKCCKRGPITDEIYCPYCGKIIIRSNDR